MNYLRALRKQDAERKLILAIPQNAYKSFFSKPEVQEALQDFGINLLIFDDQEQEIVKWLLI